MPALLKRFRAVYGSSPLHLLAMLGCFALLGYVLSVIGLTALWNPKVWWQSIVVWFLGAVLVHDIVLFPLYAVLDRSLMVLLRRREPGPGRAPLPALNYLRVPILATGLTFLVFFPGIIRQGAGTYHAATGQTQQPFFARWLLLSALFFLLSAAAYALKLGTTRYRAHR